MDHFINIAPATLNTSYEVELADGKVVSTNTILRSCTLVLCNHVFKIDLLPTRLGSFDVIIGMDWVEYHRALIDCYEKMVRIPLPNGKILEVQDERPERDLGSLACIEADEKKLDDIRFSIPVCPLEWLNCRTSLKELQEKGLYSDKSLTMGQLHALCLKKDGWSAVSSIDRYSLRISSVHEAHLLDDFGLTQEGEVVRQIFKMRILVTRSTVPRTLCQPCRYPVDLARFELVKNWKTPESSTEIRSFLGLAGETLASAPVLALPQGMVKLDGQVSLIEDGSVLLFIIFVSCLEQERTTKAHDEYVLIERIRNHFEKRDDGGWKFTSLMYWIPSVGVEGKLFMDKLILEIFRTSRRTSESLQDFFNNQKFEWKWEKITMDFVTKLPKSSRRTTSEEEISQDLYNENCSEDMVCRAAINHFRRDGTIHVTFMASFSGSVGTMTRIIVYGLPPSDDGQNGLSTEVTPGAKLCPRHVSCPSKLRNRLAEPDVQYLWMRSRSMKILAIVEEPLEIVELGCEEALKRRESIGQSLLELLRHGAAVYTWDREDQFRKRLSTSFFEPLPSSNCRHFSLGGPRHILTGKDVQGYEVGREPWADINEVAILVFLSKGTFDSLKISYTTYVFNKPIEGDQVSQLAAPAYSMRDASTDLHSLDIDHSRLSLLFHLFMKDVLLHEESDFESSGYGSEMKIVIVGPHSQKLAPEHLEGPAYEVVKAIHSNVIHLQFQMEECHKLLTNQVDEGLLRYNVSRPLPLGGPPGQVTIQTEFFFNKDLEYLRFGHKGDRLALSITKMKAASYPDAGLEQMVPDQMWAEEEYMYDISASYGISHWWFKRQQFYIDRHSADTNRRAIVKTHMRNS
ncbi:histone deacetylase 14 [Tanacetum coccineum]